ncbi:hypothetical protein [Pedobacter sp. L105]|uniref:hypothetical protein n=1 Tax=Pedobacter sp. L105 TaxID=1641871 RepID=UPI00131B7092|nr:hypothetical protein [Pedobacter sp. L105]
MNTQLHTITKQEIIDKVNNLEPQCNPLGIEKNCIVRAIDTVSWKWQVIQGHANNCETIRIGNSNVPFITLYNGDDNELLFLQGDRMPKNYKIVNSN